MTPLKQGKSVFPDLLDPASIQLTLKSFQATNRKGSTTGFQASRLRIFTRISAERNIQTLSIGSSRKLSSSAGSIVRIQHCYGMELASDLFLRICTPANALSWYGQIRACVNLTDRQLAQVSDPFTRSHVVEHITSQHPLHKEAGICFAYCYYQSPEMQDISLIVSALIRQLCRKRGDVPAGFLRRWETFLDPCAIGNQETLVSISRGFQEHF